MPYNDVCFIELTKNYLVTRKLDYILKTAFP